MTESDKKHSILAPLLFCLGLLVFVACYACYAYYAYYDATDNKSSDQIAPPDATDSKLFDYFEEVFAATTAGASLLCILFLLQLRRLYRGPRRRPGSGPGARFTIEELEERNADNLRKLKTLANQVEILSAMREISLLASQDVDFERLLDHALHLVEQAVGTHEIALFLRSQDDRQVLKIRAHRVGGKTLFSGEINPHGVDSTHVTEVARYGNIKRKETDKILILTVPVQVDREILGAVKVKIDKEELSPESLDRAESNLRNIINHISLAIKTPTLYDRAVVDGLTGLYTKRHLTAELERLFAASKRLSKALAVIMLDIDHFKKINDTHGHLSGDIVLREVASIIKQQIREYDSAYRYGGEEICILLPDADAKSAVSVAERIRKAIAKRPMRGDRNQKVRVNISGGVAIFMKHMEKQEDLVAAADKALYKAKKAGRNQIQYARPRSREVS